MSKSDINTIHKKIKMPTVVSFQKGARQNLHPKLAILDEIDCRVVYDRSVKCLFVDYDYDEEEGEYKKGIYTTSFESVVEEIKGFLAKNANVH